MQTQLRPFPNKFGKRKMAVAKLIFEGTFQNESKGQPKACLCIDNDSIQEDPMMIEKMTMLTKENSNFDRAQFDESI